MAKLDGLNKLNGAAVAEVLAKDRSRAKVVTVRMIDDSKLLDYPNNNEDVSYTADIEQSIEELGFTDPIEVTPSGQPDGFFMILSGHRRRRAGRNKGIKEFPCLVREFKEKSGGDGTQTVEQQIQNAVLMANSHRDSGKGDPLLLVNRYKMHEAYLRDSGYKGSIREAVAKRLGLSVQQADRYSQMGKVIPAVWDMVRAETVGMSSVIPMASHNPNEQEVIYGIMQDALADGVELTRSTVKRIITEYRNGKRTWAAISAGVAAEEQRTQDSGLPLNGNIKPDSGDTPDEAPVNRNDEVRREFDPIAANADLADQDRAAYEEQQGAGQDEDSLETPHGEDVPPQPKPAPTRAEIEERNGEVVKKALEKLNTALNEIYSFANTEATKGVMDIMKSTATMLAEEIYTLGKSGGLEGDAKSLLEDVLEDVAVFAKR